MIFLKGLTFILFNALPGFLIPFGLKMLLFHPREKKWLFGKPVPLTPGLAPRYKVQLIDKLEALLSEYLHDCHSEDPASRISKWEKEAYGKAWDKLALIDKAQILTQHMKDGLRHSLALIVFEAVKQFFRSFVPFLMERYEVEKYIDLVDEKLDLATIETYYRRYIYKYMLYFFLAVSALIGVANMLYYIIIQ